MPGHKLPSGIGVSQKRGTPARTVIKRPKNDHATRSALSAHLARAIAHHDSGHPQRANQAVEALLRTLQANAIDTRGIAS
jgi:hypothetical protein